ncbi:MAG: chromosome segregation protein SMC [Alphaproteobacteria bacterium]|nr:chromosome segregation protein SMC [Alphaproteobacteria bacterium]
MHLSRLRLVGFKSFVEPTELVISRGLTGVVGPNGCGKSNLLEALRWVMGESSYKSMRASAMDDVIFAGTSVRPARNAAEVTLFIDNSERLAPAEFNDTEQIEISRKIEREAGSAYRINGREARARDVKVLFEDAATGARSPALVRQGQIAEIINAKPEARRRILEDAAGVAGLHSRRHEAELRLKAAEANLARLEDVVGGLNSQMDALKRQARQARRYREISGQITKVEALALHLAWLAAQAGVEHEEKLLASVLERLAAATTAESQALRAEEQAGEGLPPLRAAMAERSAAAARLRHELEAFEREAERQAQRAEELTGRIDSYRNDIEREEKMRAESLETVGRLDGEITGLVEEEAGFGAAEKSARDDFEASQAVLEKRETELSEATGELANETARRAGLARGLEERGAASLRLEAQLAGLEESAKSASGGPQLTTEKAELEAECTEIDERLGEIEDQGSAAEQSVRSCNATVEAAREASQQIKLKSNALRTERETLARLLGPAQSDAFPALIDAVKVKPGYETALGAALGDDLDAPADDAAALHWRVVTAGDGDPSLPEGVEPLSKYVKAPTELRRRLRQIGVVSREDGKSLQDNLLPGQRLVSREGDLWRWDGFVAASEGTSAAAMRLEQRNRLAALELEEAEIAELVEARGAELTSASQALSAAQENERRLRTLWRENQNQLGAARSRLEGVQRRIAENENKLAAIEGARQRLQAQLDEQRGQLQSAEAALAGFPQEKLDQLAARQQQAQLAAQLLRSEVAEKRATLNALHAKRQERQRRTESLREDCKRWRERAAAAERQLHALQERVATARAQLDELADLPEKVDAQRTKLLDALSEADTQHRAAADKLQEAEAAAKRAVEALRSAQAAVSEAREERAGVEARASAQKQRRDDDERRIREVFDTDPMSCLAIADVPEGAELPQFDDVERRLLRLRADRERLGGVNLQADEDLELIAAQVNAIETERTDVQQAIDKLRQAIAQLNREGRRRINEAFDTVNAHFGRLFETLFNGGEARLEMIQSQEDPLEGGLEIIAKPPGKKPATLSLLSGGEQTLTSLALIFAVFLTNPSPICVLDEVDAPLDDANVDRFCTLMENMAEETSTRFLVITHHPMTMTRMHRLFGVTMAEKGISQLVSVDLETAQGFREAG